MSEYVGVGLAGAALRWADLVVPKDPEQWVFGAFDGRRFVDNPKYLFSYVHEQLGAEHVCWISRSEQVLRELERLGLPAHHNFSPRGLWKVLRAGNLVVSTKRSDVLFFYRRSGRRIVFLTHGMPYKRPSGDTKGRQRRLSDLPILDWVWTAVAAGFRWPDADLIASTSEFLQRILEGAYRSPRVFVTGMPRTDVLVDPRAPHLRPLSIPSDAEIRSQLGLGDGFLVTYMPTHRRYGVGQQASIPFASDKHAQRQLREAGVRIAVKLHPEATRDLASELRDAVPGLYHDVSIRCEDPQLLLRVTDCLVTDYSSCFFDFLLLDRPLVFFVPDMEEFTQYDNGLYFPPSQYPTGPVVREEKDLMQALVMASKGVDEYRERRAKASALFNAYRDAASCRRVFEMITCQARSRP